jgi:hypothetical protein
VRSAAQRSKVQRRAALQKLTSSYARRRTRFLDWVHISGLHHRFRHGRNNVLIARR